MHRGGSPAEAVLGTEPGQRPSQGASVIIPPLWKVERLRKVKCLFHHCTGNKPRSLDLNLGVTLSVGPRLPVLPESCKAGVEECGRRQPRALEAPLTAFHIPLPLSVPGPGVAFSIGFSLCVRNHVALSPAVKEKAVESRGNDDS